MREKRGDGELSSGGVAAWISDLAGGGDGRAGSEFREAVDPLRVEAVIGGEVDDEGFVPAVIAFAFTGGQRGGLGGGDSVDVGSSEAVGQGEDEDVDCRVGP